MSDTDSREEEVEGWVKIQQNTFTNWVNDRLGSNTVYPATQVTSVKTDFQDGTNLCYLVSALQKRKMPKIITKKNIKYYESCGNLGVALDNIRADGVRLVNIGAEDIHSGNLKLILGMLWLLIRRYQIGSHAQSKLPPKKLMLAWINAVLHPHMTIGNFSKDWNDGVALHGILNYCQPGQFPNWAGMNRSNRLENCRLAMETARDLWDIPMVVSPENMSSYEMDELSGMTYLSYFMNPDSPGYKATMGWVKQTISPTPVENFGKDWNNGFVAGALVNGVGGSVREWPNLPTDSSVACQCALDVSYNELNIPRLMTGKDMANPEVDHIAVMAYAAWHRHAQPSTPPPRADTPPPVVVPIIAPVRPPSPEPVRAPTPPPLVITPPVGLTGINVKVDRQWRLDATATIEVDTSAVGGGGVRVTATSPNDEQEDLVVSRIADFKHSAPFRPSGRGDWRIEVFYDGQPVEANPFMMTIYDAGRARLIRAPGNPMRGLSYPFEVDCVDVGITDTSVYVIFTPESRAVPCNRVTTQLDRWDYSFIAEDVGMYTVSIYVGGVEIEDSPFNLFVVDEDVGDVGASGPGLVSSIQNHEAQFEVDTRTNPGQHLEVTVQAPSGRILPVGVLKGNDDKTQVNYTPDEIGNHTVTILYGLANVAGSPFSVYIRAPEVHVRGLSTLAKNNQPSQFEVDASEVRNGVIELDSNLPVHRYDKLGSNRYMITFIPRRVGVHDLVIKCNNREVTGSPYSVNVTN